MSDMEERIKKLRESRFQSKYKRLKRSKPNESGKKKKRV